ncbi:Aste57867_23897 [Aphanomyces stellatus]|uniref:Aste57867_23897 protein n=1 Tax=Aphanomyces stellatus TaxID=120398 RepID=A0A485LPQ6_9STRA|nr:hypothetical protein As57867_023824 [Aphanomyces stellatus]VFU00540.1 Aste57867_23897 [Aphanomyces stellatus]
MHEVESAVSVAVGVCLGAIILLVLNYFPGEPFDYSIKEEDEMSPTAAQNGAAQDLDIDDTPDILNELPPPPALRQRQAHLDAIEVEKAARAVRIDKLQSMLGLEEDTIRAMVADAKRDALAGKRPPPPPTNYMAWIDRMVYLTFFILLGYFAWRDYQIDVLALLAHAFPREAATLRQLVSI